MCGIDIVILILVIILIIQGLVVGFVRSIFDLAGIILGIFLALEYSERLSIPKYVAFLVIFLATVIVVSLLGRLLARLIHLTPLGIMDRLMGGGLGFIKGLFFSFVLIIVLFLFGKERLIAKCEIAPMIFKSGMAIAQMLPEKWYKWLKRITKKEERLRAEKNDYYLYLGFWQ